MKLLKKIYHWLPVDDKQKTRLKHIYKAHVAPWLEDIPQSTVKTPDSFTNSDYLAELFRRSEEKSADYVAKGTDHYHWQVGDIKLIAFYLPQYHPFQENDMWWGEGFTEWRNVANAVPQFCGHYQPQLPDALGFYDLRLPEVQQKQAQMAKDAGIYGFCYYYYWFSGKLLMERPLRQLLEHKEIDFPFCICWANENWTRRWDGLEQDVLIKQSYAVEDDLRFIQDAAEILSDKRYIRIAGKPFLLIYRIGLLPDASRTIKCWRNYWQEHYGEDLYIGIIRGHDFVDLKSCGGDVVIDFPPHTISCPDITDRIKPTNKNFSGIVYDLEAYINSDKCMQKMDYPYIRSVMPSWDNTARKKNNGIIYYGSSPDNYEKWLKKVMRTTKENNPQELQFVFINAWNEWAEGAHLEPDQKYGYAYLEKTKKCMREYGSEGR